MIHIGEGTSSTIISKGISAGNSKNAYRGLVRMARTAKNARNFTQCDSLLLGSDCSAQTYPYIENKNSSSKIEHEASTSKISDEQLFYLRSRGVEGDKASALLLKGAFKEIIDKLPPLARRWNPLHSIFEGYLR